MSEDFRHKPDKNAAGLMALLIVLPLVYGLSIGPVGYLLVKFHAPSNWRPYMTAFYQPLIWLGENTSFKEPLEAYVGWWLELAIR